MANPDTKGAGDSVVISEVSSFQRLKYILGWEKVSCLERCQYRRSVAMAHLYTLRTLKLLFTSGKVLVIQQFQHLQITPLRKKFMATTLSYFL